MSDRLPVESAATGKLMGEPSIVAEPITRAVGVNPNASFWIGPRGLLTYRKSDVEAQRRLVWISRDGARLQQLPKENRYSSFFLSPDGKRLAVDVMNENGVHVAPFVSTLAPHPNTIRASIRANDPIANAATTSAQSPVPSPTLDRRLAT